MAHEIIGQAGGLRPAGMDDTMFENVRRQVVEQFQNEARQVHRCLMAAGRLDGAAKMVAAAREIGPTLVFQ